MAARSATRAGTGSSALPLWRGWTPPIPLSLLIDHGGRRIASTRPAELAPFFRTGSPARSWFKWRGLPACSPSRTRMFTKVGWRPTIIGPTDGRTRVTDTRRPPDSAVTDIERDFGDGRLTGCIAFFVSPRTLLTAASHHQPGSPGAQLAARGGAHPGHAGPG